MEKDWPPLPECVQKKYGLMYRSQFKYPWEDEEYAFDFESYYPPIPDELACLRKLLDCMRKNKNSRAPCPEDIRKCPFCPLDSYPLWRDIRATTNPKDVDLLNHQVWNMDPIPCPYHLFSHVWPEGVAPAIITPQELEDTKKYLNQVRNSRGYDVDCFPHPNLVYAAFRECDLNYKSKAKLDATVIKHIELKTGKNYKLEEVLKIVSTDRCMTLVTFTAKVDDSAAASETFIATLAEEFTLPDTIDECLLKPDCAAPGPDQYPDSPIVQPIGIPGIMGLYMMNTNHPHTEDHPKLWEVPRTPGIVFAPETYSASKRIRRVAELDPVVKKLMLAAGLDLYAWEASQRELDPEDSSCLDPEDASCLHPENADPSSEVEKQKKRDIRVIEKQMRLESLSIGKRKKYSELSTREEVIERLEEISAIKKQKRLEA